MFKNRGFTDKLYFINFICVTLIGFADVTLTALSGRLGITDLSALGTLTQYAYLELGVHTGFIIWKSRMENILKFNKEAAKDGVNQIESGDMHG